MSATIVFRAGYRGEETVQSLAPLCDDLRGRQQSLQRLRSEEILDVFETFALALPTDARTRNTDGLAFLATRLRRANLTRLLETSLPLAAEALERFVELPNEQTYLRAQPAGLVCQWIAGNVPTLMFFSLVPSLLARNPTLVKLPTAQREPVSALLAVLADATRQSTGARELLEATAVVDYDHADQMLGEEMSLAADVKVFWGGEAAFRGVTGLPRQPHCSEVIFGPKYSLAVMDAAVVANDQRLHPAAARLAADIVAFEQAACSSPQTLFVEGDLPACRRCADALAAALERLPPKQQITPYEASRIVGIRATYGMASDLDLRQSGRRNDWTLCLGGDIELPEAIQSRTLFIRPVEQLDDVLPLLSQRTQTVGVALGSQEAALAFAEEATARGVARVVRFGLMNVYDSPWDGKLLLGQLVRWVVAKP